MNSKIGISLGATSFMLFSILLINIFLPVLFEEELTRVWWGVALGLSTILTVATLPFLSNNLINQEISYNRFLFRICFLNISIPLALFFFYSNGYMYCFGLFLPFLFLLNYINMNINVLINSLYKDSRNIAIISIAVGSMAVPIFILCLKLVNKDLTFLSFLLVYIVMIILSFFGHRDVFEKKVVAINKSTLRTLFSQVKQSKIRHYMFSLTLFRIATGAVSPFLVVYMHELLNFAFSDGGIVVAAASPGIFLGAALMLKLKAKDTLLFFLGIVFWTAGPLLLALAPIFTSASPVIKEFIFYLAFPVIFISGMGMGWVLASIKNIVYEKSGSLAEKEANIIFFTFTEHIGLLFGGILGALSIYAGAQNILFVCVGLLFFSLGLIGSSHQPLSR